ncbi:MAG: hypothetical protein JWM98_329, partial [Thermoleophilia bacterium]|nr:hypothetical protein [Thermoleophilia bacterium]
MAPIGAGAGNAGALPSLTGGAAGQGAGQAGSALPNAGAATDPTAAGATGGAGTPAAAGALPGGMDITKLASSARWMGPLMAVGGAGLAIKGFQSAAVSKAILEAGGTVAKSGGGWMKWAGVGAALSGLALTGIGFKAKGVEVGGAAKEAEAVAAIQQLNAQYESTMQNLTTEASTQITTLQQQLAAAKQGGGATPGATDPSATGQGTTPGATPTPGAQAPGAQTPSSNTLPATQNADGTTTEHGQIVDGATPGVGIGLNTTSVPTDPTAATGATTGGAWSPTALKGLTKQLEAGTSPGGTTIADAGNYKIEGLAGDPNGYASVDEANAAARATMSTELMGSKFLRWMVVEHGGRFYGAIGKQLAAGEQPKLLTPEAGNVVAWSAMNHVSENGAAGWQAYSWTQAGGAKTISVPYGTANVFGGAGATGTGSGTATGTGTTTGTGTGTTAGGGGTTTGTGTAPRSVEELGALGATGAAAPKAFDPASVIGRSFSINASSTAEGDLAR